LVLIALVLGIFFYFRRRRKHELKVNNWNGEDPQLKYAEADAARQYAEADPAHALPAELSQNYEHQPIMVELPYNSLVNQQPMSYSIYGTSDPHRVSSPNTLPQASPLLSSASVSPQTSPRPPQNADEEAKINELQARINQAREERQRLSLAKLRELEAMEAELARAQHRAR
jgi:hypothetical protein